MPDIAPAPAATETAPAELPKDVANAPVKEAPKRLKIADYEFADENAAKSEIERGRQSGKLLTEAQKRLEAADRKERDFKAKVRGAKGSPAKLAAVLADEGWSREEISDHFGKYIYENDILPREMSPEQKRIRELEAKQAEYENEKKAKDKEGKDAEFKKQVEGEIQKLKAELEPLLNAKKIPNTRVALKRMAMMMASYQEAGVAIPAARAVDMLMQDYQTEFGELLDGANPDQLEAFLGKERMTKLARSISQWAIGRMKGKSPATESETIDPVTKAKSPDNKKMTPNQFNKFIGGI